MQLFRVMTNTIGDQSVHEYIVMADDESDAANIAVGNVKGNNPFKGLNPIEVSQGNTRVLSVQRTIKPNCIEINTFPLSMARDLIGRNF
jgi:hypothetical protein